MIFGEKNCVKIPENCEYTRGFLFRKVLLLVVEVCYESIVSIQKFSILKIIIFWMFVDEKCYCNMIGKVFVTIVLLKLQAHRNLNALLERILSQRF